MKWIYLVCNNVVNIVISKQDLFVSPAHALCNNVVNIVNSKQPTAYTVQPVHVTMLLIV